MANIKVTFLLELTTFDQGFAEPARQAGWSESFVCVAGDVNAPQLPTIALNWATRRVAVLANQGKITGARFHDLSSNATRAYPMTGWQGTGGNCGLPHLTMLLRLFAVNGQNTRFFEMRGIPDIWQQTGELNSKSVAYGPLRNLMNYTVNAFGMLGVNKSFPHFKVDNVSAAGVVTLKEQVAGINANDTVQFYRTQYDDTCCGAIGQFTVAAAGGKVINLQAPLPTGDAFGGKVAKWTPPAFLQFDTGQTTQGGPNGWSVERLVIRKTGRPFDLFSGRRSRKCCKC